MYLYIQRGCEDLLHGFDVDDLEKNPSSVIGVKPDGEIFYVNSAWHFFARMNGGKETIARNWSLGANWLACLPDVVRPGYEQLFQAALNQPREARTPVQHCYECSSPAKFREFTMTLHPLVDGEGVLMWHSASCQQPHSRPSYPASEQLYRQPDGLVHQCCYCRRVKHRGAEHRWDWIPDWVSSMPEGTSHTLCGICKQSYYAAIGLHDV